MLGRLIRDAVADCVIAFIEGVECAGWPSTLLGVAVVKEWRRYVLGINTENRPVLDPEWPQAHRRAPGLRRAALVFVVVPSRYVADMDSGDRHMVERLHVAIIDLRTGVDAGHRDQSIGRHDIRRGPGVRRGIVCRPRSEARPTSG